MPVMPQDVYQQGYTVGSTGDLGLCEILLACHYITVRFTDRGRHCLVGCCVYVTLQQGREKVLT